MSTEAARPKVGGISGHAWVGRALLVNGTLLATTAVVWLTALRGLNPPGGEHLSFLPLVALGTFGATGHGVPIRNRRSSVHLALAEMPIVVAMVYLRPLEGLVAVLVGQAVAEARTRRAAWKVASNCLALSTSLSLGLLVYHHVIGGARPTTAMGWAAVALALTVLLVADLLLVITSGSVVRWRAASPPLRDLALQVSLNIAVGTLSGILAVAMASVGTWTLMAFASIAVPALLGWRRAETARRRYNGLERLYESVRRIDLAEGGERQVISVMLEESRSLLAAGMAAVMVPLEPPLDHLGLSAKIIEEGPVVFREAQPLGAVSALMAEQGPMVLHRRQGREVAEALAEEGIREAIAVPLRNGDTVPGYLLVADRPYAHEGFDGEDLTMLGALAGNAEVVLRKSTLLEKLRYEAAVREHEARHDALTGLPNRESFTELLNGALAGLAPGTKVAVLLVDLDDFKHVNDTLGHQMGDMVLAAVARRLGPFSAQGTVVARVGGDEFVMYMPGADDRAALAQAEMAREAIARTMRVATVELAVGASVGITVEPAASTDSQRLLSHADIALHQAKAGARGTCLYSDGADRKALRRLQMVGELRRAIEHGGLELHYQPVHDVATKQLVSCEALARWDHERFGRVAPDEFIPLAERAGLIDPLTWWALDTALSQVKQWRQSVPDLKVAVNLSPRSLGRSNLVELVDNALRRNQVGSDALRLELTESSLMAVKGRDAVRALSELVELSIDDFGTSWSSLKRLRHLPFAEVKVDRSFVSQMEPGSDDEAIVRYVIQLARGLDILVTAEGVETQATLDHLEALGCNSAQGYYLGRPVPASEFGAVLLSGTGAPVPARPGAAGTTLIGRS